MGKHSPKKIIGIVAGSIIGLILIFSLGGSHQQPTANLNSAPASTTQATDQSNTSASPQSTDSTTSTSDNTDSQLPDSSQATTDNTDSSTTDDTGLSDPNLSNDNTYTNVDGTTVHSPADSTDGTIPTGATAQCVDGTYSFSQHHSGTCSYHGGVAQWLQ